MLMYMYIRFHPRWVTLIGGCMTCGGCLGIFRVVSSFE